VSTLTEGAFTLGCLAGRDDANHSAMLTLAMADDKQLCRRTHTQHQEALFAGRVIVIEELDALFIEKIDLASSKEI
jgi:hypothetical protein